MNLQELLASKGVNQVDLMDDLNCSESQVSLLVNGKRKMTVEVAAIIAKRLGVTIEVVFEALNLTKRKDGKEISSDAEAKAG